MTIAATTAEWICTRCGSTNRILVPSTTRTTVDRCLHCGSRHTVEPADRPVRWHARLLD
jgi:DNA-directed RNA polymerase subunit RPC12/RpoP